jgi:gamma-D-glutamyl-L-lysine dipeptidyl-peptidase
MKHKLISFFICFLFACPLFAQDTGYGICLREYIAVRAVTSDTAEQVTQLLFGDAFKITKKSTDKKWFYIQNSYDKYEGWIHNWQSDSISKAYFEDYEAKNHPVSADLHGSVVIGNKKVSVPMGSTLPFYATNYIKIGDSMYKFTGKTKNIAQKSDKATLLAVAKKYLKSPYLWGGKSPKGLDCSGFTQMVFKLNGYQLRRDSYQQVEQGKWVALKDAQPGDLIFFTTKQGEDARVTHVGIFLEKGKIIHSFKNVQIDAIDAKGNLSQYKRYFKCLKRLE